MTLFPLMSVVIVSLYVHGGASRVAVLGLLVGSVIAAVAGLVLKRGSVANR